MNKAALAFNARYNLNVSPKAFQATELNFNVANDLIGKPKRNIVQAMRRFVAKPSSLVALVIIIGIIILSITLPLLSPHSSVQPVVDRAGENNVFSNLPPAGTWLTRLMTVQQITRLNNFGMVLNVDYFFVGSADNLQVTGQAFVRYDAWKFATNIARDGGLDLVNVSVLGTDELGRDVWTRTWDGTWGSLKLGVISALGSAVFGTVLGCLVGLRYGTWIDIAVNRLIDAYTNIPYLVWISLLISLFPQNFWGLVAFFIIVSWTASFGVARFNIIKFINTDYMKAAKVTGVAPLGRIFKHALPNFIGIMAMSVAGLISSTIIVQAYIGILGFTFQGEAAYLGNVMQEMRSATSGPTQNLLFVLVPTAILIILTLSLRYIALGINDAVDPKYARR